MDRARIAGAAAPPLLRALARTWRVREWPADDADADSPRAARSPRRRLAPAVHALWHAELLPLMLVYAPCRMATMISHHRDGEIAARVVEALGSRAVRGSSSAGGGEALRQMEDLGRDGWPLAITTDGPRGPARVSKPGVVRLAAATGRPIVPVGARPVTGWRLRSWDRFIVPRPFTTVHVEFAPPIHVPPDAAESDLSAWLSRVDEALAAVSERCRRRAAGEAGGTARSGEPA